MKQAARRLECIEEYDFTIQHRAGSSHGNCDALSRRPPSESVAHYFRLENSTAIQAASSLELTPAVIVEAQSMDEDMKPILTVMRNGGSRPFWKDIQSYSEETRSLWAQFASLCIHNDILYRKFYQADGAIERLQIVMPHSLRKTFLKSLHGSEGNVATAHLGIRKTQCHVQHRAYWLRWRTDTELFCLRCPVCQTVQSGNAPRHGHMKTYEANDPGDRLHIDLTGPHPTTRQGHIYILTAIDAYTRYLTSVPLRNTSALTVANALVEHVFLPFGSYRTVVSDQGREFCNSFLEEVTSLLGIEKLRTTAYRASANGRVEGVHRTMNILLCKIIDENQKDWSERLPMVVAAYNAAQHESTEYSPYYLMYRRAYRTPLDLTLDTPEVAHQNQSDFIAQLQERIWSAFVTVNKRLQTKTQE
jgi:transposase InsO family protein